MGPYIAKHTVSWNSVTTYSDGSPVPAGVTLGYKVYWNNGTTGFVNTQVADVKSALSLDLTALNLAPGTYNLAISCYDSNGNESVLSSSVPFPFIVPSSPTGLKVS